MKTVDQYNFAGKKALIRVDFNVPLNKEYGIKELDPFADQKSEGWAHEVFALAFFFL